MTESASSGWELVAGDDDAATVIRGILSLDPEKEYPRSELAEAAGIPLKTLYLVDTLEQLERAGMVDRVDDREDEEACFAIDEDNDLYQAAQEFDRVFAEQLQTVEK